MQSVLIKGAQPCQAQSELQLQSQIAPTYKEIVLASACVKAETASACEAVASREIALEPTSVPNVAKHAQKKRRQRCRKQPQDESMSSDSEYTQVASGYESCSDSNHSD